jgi:hypothetical protein
MFEGGIAMINRSKRIALKVLGVGIAFVAMIGLGGCDSSEGMNHNIKNSQIDDTKRQEGTPDNGTQNSITLVASADSNLDVIAIHFEKAPAAHGPRVAELRLSLSDNLSFVSAHAGEALQAAGKDLIAQVDNEGVIRLVAFAGSNVNEVGSGVLATVKVKRQGSGPSTATLLLDNPLFAPAEANEGLLVNGQVTF